MRKITTALFLMLTLSPGLIFASEQSTTLTEGFGGNVVDDTYSSAGMIHELEGDTNGDYEKALNLYEKGSEKGFYVSQYRLGSMYFRGKGVDQDYQQALKWFELSAEQGYSPAELGMGMIYYQDDATPQDYQQALMWFLRAAEQGEVIAQSQLGMMHFFGEGVKQDDEKAKDWFSMACENGYRVGCDAYQEVVSQ